MVRLLGLEVEIAGSMPVDPYFALGWIMAASGAQALCQRPAVWVVAGEGAGKSTLQEFFKRLTD